MARQTKAQTFASSLQIRPDVLGPIPQARGANLLYMLFELVVLLRRQVHAQPGEVTRGGHLWLWNLDPVCLSVTVPTRARAHQNIAGIRRRARRTR